jgi:hypothetical protein
MRRSASACEAECAAGQGFLPEAHTLLDEGVVPNNIVLENLQDVNFLFLCFNLKFFNKSFQFLKKLLAIFYVACYIYYSMLQEVISLVKT